MSEPESPLFCYSLEIQGREFMIYVSHDGAIYWDDYQDRRAARPPEERYLEIRMIVGDENARKRLDAETAEYTITFQLPLDVFLRIQEAARRFDADDWTTEDEIELNKHLEPLFWSEVNPYINKALHKPQKGERES
jgi:hypothetical protein